MSVLLALLVYALVLALLLTVLRLIHWKTQWEQMSVRYARALDELAAVREALHNPFAAHTGFVDIVTEGDREIDAARLRPGAVVLGVPPAQATRLVPEGGARPAGPPPAPESLQGVPPRGGLGPPGAAATVETITGRRYACQHGIFKTPCPSCWTGDPALPQTVRPVRGVSLTDDLG